MKIKNYYYLKGILSLIVTISFTSCMFNPVYEKRPDKKTNYKRSHVFAVFMDGTSNKPKAIAIKNTNIYELKTITNPDVPSYYIEGVGNEAKILGMGFGLGVSRRVRMTYQFLAENYDLNDTLCLFGFSRGAYSCRILSNMIYVAGIPNLRNIKSDKIKEKIIRKLYQNYRGNYTVKERKERITKFVNEWNSKNEDYRITVDTNNTIKIDFMGLFDTVEALAAPNYSEVFSNVNKNHLDQIENINKVCHAIALDDNRSHVFTPVLIGTRSLQESTTKKINDVVEEVWFSGCHTDIGGSQTSYPENRNTSLNWMISKSKPLRLFKDDAKYIEYPYNPVKNMQEDIEWLLLYRKNNRSIVNYYYDGGCNKKIKIHESVIKRLEVGAAPEFKVFKRDTLDWFDKLPFSKCFIKEGKKRIFKKDCDCIEVVKTVN